MRRCWPRQLGRNCRRDARFHGIGRGCRTCHRLGYQGHPPESSLRAAAIYLQPLALPTRIRHQLGREGQPLLSELSAAFAHRVGEPRPSFRPRIQASTILTLAVGGGAVYLLLPQISAVPRLFYTVRHGEYWWLAARPLPRRHPRPETSAQLRPPSSPD